MARWWRWNRPARPARSAAAEDARALALGLAGLAPVDRVEPMDLGLVLEPGEAAYRVITGWLSHRALGRWSAPETVSVVVTDHRLIARMPGGSVTSLWWGSLVGFHPDLSHSALVLDYGDGYPRRLSGPQVPAVVVVGIVALYGVDGLARHAALEPLRDAGR